MQITEGTVPLRSHRTRYRIAGPWPAPDRPPLLVLHGGPGVPHGHLWDLVGAEWNLTGSLKDWDVTARLPELHLPVLITTGRYDEVTPEAVRPLAEGIPGARWEVFEHSAHLATAEEPERYRAVLDAFLTEAEAAG